MRRGSEQKWFIQSAVNNNIWFNTRDIEITLRETIQQKFSVLLCLRILLKVAFADTSCVVTVYTFHYSRMLTLLGPSRH